MGQGELLLICASAFAAVFILLSVLALLMKLIIVVFPAKAVQIDTAMMAAVATVVSSIYPGTKLTKIEEIK
ncbi:MAG: hypothetical protein GY839_03205 [candidate division Zixibacteria bacterium]|nr:hypothetical protein [candidate division Zixibacteria bacterium]